LQGSTDAELVAAISSKTGVNQALTYLYRQYYRPLFKPEIEYYLAMAYLADNQCSKSVSLLESIRRDEQHPYHDQLQTTDWWTLKLKALIE
jgi:hypothetical protein